MAHLTARRILLGISGGIAAYKAAELCRILRRDGAELRVVMTERATAFITPLSLQALSGQPVHYKLMDAASEAGMGHIELARWADLVLIAPASADCIARLSQGRADDLLSALCLATNAPLVLAPAMNKNMWHHPATQRNCVQLTEQGATLLGPGSGDQACGDNGLGRMLEPEEVASAVAKLFSARLLEGVRAMVTAGPSREALDPVRYLGNRSSGRMGFAMATALRDAGAEVCLVAGPVALSTPERLRRIDVESAEEMLQAVLDQLPDCQLFVAAAAVADFRPTQPVTHKLRRADGVPTLTLEPTPDVLAAVAGRQPPPFLVGFAAETSAVADNGQRKLVEKKLDMVIANDVSRSDIGFDSDENEVVILHPKGEQTLPRASKTQLASTIVQVIAEHYLAADGPTQPVTHKLRHAPQYAPTTVQRGGDTIATLLHATNALPRLDAELLLAHCLDTDCGQLYAYPEQPVAVATARRYHELAAARQRGVPLAYLRGWQGFWTLTVQVDPRVLVPRPESELLVEAALSRVAARWAQCAELGTGSGAIAWALARERPEWRILAIDRCADALAVASANRHQLRCHNTQLIQSDWGSALAGQRFDLLVSNPPYIDENDPQLRQAPLSCEPRGALASGGGGMSALRRLVSELPSRLVSGGWLMLEHAPWQATELRCALRAQGCLKTTTLRDLADHERVTLGCAP